MKVKIKGTQYPIQVTKYEMATAGSKSSTSITVNALPPAGSYFIIYAGGNGAKYFVYFTLNGVGNTPQLASWNETAIRVDFTALTTNNQLATLIATAINTATATADPWYSFTASANTNVVTAQRNVTGAVTATADGPSISGNNTGFVLADTQGTFGVDSTTPLIHITGHYINPTVVWQGLSLTQQQLSDVTYDYYVPLTQIDWFLP